MTGACRSRTASVADRAPPIGGFGPARAGRRLTSIHLHPREAAVSTWLWIILVVAVVIIAVLILSATIQRRRTERLREGFGPEYDRTVERAGGRGAAEAELRDRQQPPRRAGAAARSRRWPARASWTPGRARRPSSSDDPAVAISRRRSPHPERDARPRLPRRGLRGPRGARLRRPSAGRRALPPGARRSPSRTPTAAPTPRTCASPCRTTARCSSSWSSATPSTPRNACAGRQGSGP